MKPLKILYFINGSGIPTAEQTLEAHRLGHQICFRNALVVPNEGALEDCDGVMGDVPERYSEKYPTAEVAIEKRLNALAALAAIAGDSPAPVGPQGDAAANASPDVQQAATAGAGAADGAGDATAADLAAKAPGAAPAAGSVWKPNR
jgi:hypothetical protein